MNSIIESSVMYLRFGKSKNLLQVSSYSEASRKFIEAEKAAHDRLVFKMPFIAILDKDMHQIAKISPNGRIWDMSEHLIQERVKI